MSGRAKNIIIVILLLIIAGLIWYITNINYGRYCSPAIKDQKKVPIIKSDSNKL